MLDYQKCMTPGFFKSGTCIRLSLNTSCSFFEWSRGKNEKQGFYKVLLFCLAHLPSHSLIVLGKVMEHMAQWS